LKKEFIMKRIIITVLSIISLSAYSQKGEEYPEVNVPIDSETKLITYSNVVEFGANKDELFEKANAWFHSYFKNPTGVIRERDAAKGEIMGKHQMRIFNPHDKKGVQTMKGIIMYSVTVQTRDNRARIILNEFNIRSNSYTAIDDWADKSSRNYSNLNNYYLEQIDKEMKELLDNFNKFMMAGPEEKKDDW